MCRGFVQLRVDLTVQYLRCRRLAKLRHSNVHRLVFTDGHSGRARLRQVLQLLHGELCQRIKLQLRVDGKDAIHQCRLPCGNVVFLCLLVSRRILRQGLRQDGGLRFTGLQNAVHGVSQLTLKLFRTGGILVLHRDHNGRGNAAEIAVAHKAAYNGVYRHIQLGSLEICPVSHIRKDRLCIVIERRADQYLFAPADLQLDAGVYIQRHHGRHRIRLLIEYTSAAQQHHRKAGSYECRPFFPCRFFCCHIDHRSFPHFTAGENAAHIVRRSFFKGRGQPLLHFFVSHRASSPSRVLRIFFNAL